MAAPQAPPRGNKKMKESSSAGAACHKSRVNCKTAQQLNNNTPCISSPPTGRGPDAGRTIEFKERDAHRTRTGRGRGRFSLGGGGGSGRRRWVVAVDGGGSGGGGRRRQAVAGRCCKSVIPLENSTIRPLKCSGHQIRPSPPKTQLFLHILPLTLGR
eukprot:gene15624-biopygen21725